jgi:hypothetical protein
MAPAASRDDSQYHESSNSGSGTGATFSEYTSGALTRLPGRYADGRVCRIEGAAHAESRTENRNAARIGRRSSQTSSSSSRNLLYGGASLFAFRLLVNKNRRFPPTELVNAMYAASAAVWRFLTFCKLLNHSPVSPHTRLILLCAFDPADKFVTPDRGEPFSKAAGPFHLAERIEHVIGRGMHQPARKFLRHESRSTRPPARGQQPPLN